LQDGPDSRSEGRNISCRFTALNDDLIFRPLRLTPKPHVPGIQSATVVGPTSSEVHTDALSRIRVHFHWDRETTTEEDASCWMRVAQSWTGKGWGIIAMPRVGQEVIVTYLDGDLDQPLVTGMVYNGENTPPYDLPERINYSGLVSRSLKHGMPQNASQITFDDARGAERVMIHAERDLQQTVERNVSQSVGQDAYMNVTRTYTANAENYLTYATNKVTNATTDVQNIDNHFSTINNVVRTIKDSVTQTGSSVKYTAESKSVTGKSTSMTEIFKLVDA
jgi:type VI secretion system secreted protein VgrG